MVPANGDGVKHGVGASADAAGPPGLESTTNLAILWLQMRYEVMLAPEAATAYRSLPAYRRAEVRDALERHLRHEPTRVSKSRIKRLRGSSQPQYRLRVGEVRVFYDVTREAVEILAIVTKDEAAAWLAERSTPDAPRSTG